MYLNIVVKLGLKYVYTMKYFNAQSNYLWNCHKQLHRLGKILENIPTQIYPQQSDAYIIDLRQPS